MIRRLMIVVALFALGCSAQNSNNADLTRRIDRQIRATYHLPAQLKLGIGERKSSEFSGYDTIKVTMGNGERSQSFDFLISKDGNTLIQMNKMDLGKDPYAEIMKKIDVTGRPTRGAKDAKVTVVVYDDFQCPFCSRMHAVLFQDVMKTYGDRVKIIYKDYPLFEIHPWAGRAAINANCLATQSAGAYWDYADFLHYNGRAIQGEKRPLDLQVSELDKLTLDLGRKHSVDSAKLAQCVKEQPQEALQDSVKEADTLGVTGTPAMFINGYKLDGAVPAEEIKAALDMALRDAGQQAPAGDTSARQ